MQNQDTGAQRSTRIRARLGGTFATGAQNVAAIAASEEVPDTDPPSAWTPDCEELSRSAPPPVLGRLLDPMKLAVCHPSPAVVRALVDGLLKVGLAALDGPDDLVEWWDTNQPAGAVLPLNHRAWDDLRRESPTGFLVALIDDDTPESYAKAFAKEATGVVATCWETERMARAVQDAIAGFSTIRFDVVRMMAARAEGPPTDLVLSLTEAEALRLLCGGATVVAISNHLGYSEREMHRILGSLYRRMGVGHRNEAIVCAAKWGLADS